MLIVLSRMNHIRQVDIPNRYVVVEPGGWESVREPHERVVKESDLEKV